MGKLTNVKVGDTIYEVLKSYGRGDAEPTPRTVTKIGRRWVSYSSGWTGSRADIEDGEIDGGEYASPGRVYATLAEYTDHQARKAAWVGIRQAMGYTPPDHLPTQALLDFLKALKEPT